MELSVDQIRIVNSKTKGQSLIKGVAGSGKTTVALFKLIQMQQQKTLQKEKVLVVTYNKTLIHYMEYLCQEYGVSIDNEKVDIRTIDSLIYLEAKKSKEKYRMLQPAERMDYMKRAIQKVAANYPNNSVINVKNIHFLMEEVDWMKHCLYLKREDYLQVERLGRNSIGDNRFRLAKNSENRNAIFDLFMVYEHLLDQDHVTDFASKAVRVYSQIKRGEITPKRYQFIIVDESQDLSRVQLEIIRSVYEDSENSNIIFIADVAQSIYTNSWLSKQSFKSVGFDMSGKSNILSKNYRTTKQIAEAAYSLLNHDRELKKSNDYVEPELLERNGSKPKYRHFETKEQEFAYIAAEIKKCANRYELQDIVVVAKENEYLNRLQDYLMKHGIDAGVFKNAEKGKQNAFLQNKVKLFTLYAIKGLEAEVVFIVGINEGILPYSYNAVDVERKLLYVGMTRARERLYLTSSQKESVYISEMDTKCLQLTDEELETESDIAIDMYQSFGRMKNITQKEEQVRQWYISQLELRYGYPKALLEPEAKVQCGSHTFYVDIAVYKDVNREIPWIYVETKKAGENLKDAMRQVKSYIVPGNAPEYIVVTDKNEQIVEQYKEGKYIPCEDLPFYNESVKEYEELCYIDFIHGRQLDYRCTLNNKEPILYQMTGTAQLDCEYLPVKGEVAAGNLKYVNEQYGENCPVPMELLKDANMKFVLNVSGDSMVDFNILDGDRIIIQKQSIAPEGSVVVGGNMMTNEATVKQFHYDGEEHVVLHPGNAKYQDILIKSEEFFINGVVVGVIRKR